MSHFTLIHPHIDVAPILAELDARPDLWDRRPERRGGTSPHRETSDIWLRYMDPALILTHDFSKPHRSVWYPEANALPSLHDIIMQVRDAFGGALEMGGHLITRIAPGRQVYPHHDLGTWHSEYFTDKVWIPLRANDQCVNWVEDESMVWKPGEVWQHDNLITHAVSNNGDTERICLILTFRRMD